jgi:hypothetical protein
VIKELQHAVPVEEDDVDVRFSTILSFHGGKIVPREYRRKMLYTASMRLYFRILSAALLLLSTLTPVSAARPFGVSANALGERLIEVEFFRSMRRSDIRDISDYSLMDEATGEMLRISSVKVFDGKFVHLRTEKSLLGDRAVFLLTIKNLRIAPGKIIDKKIEVYGFHPVCGSC